MEYTLTKINAGSLARFTFFAMAILAGIIFSIMYVFTVIATLFTGKISLFFTTALFGLFLLILGVGLYALIGAVVSWVYAFIYNLLAKQFGGIQFELSSSTEEKTKKEK